MVGTVTATTDAAATAAAMKKTLGLNKDDFVQLFITQLKYQDPLKPQDASAMLDQLSQLSLVEQSYNNNTAMNNMLKAQNNSISLSALSLIGKDVKAAGNLLSYGGETPVTAEFNLSQPAEKVLLSIADGTGKVVRTVSLESLKSGDNSFRWDGLDNSGLQLSAGRYTFSVNATDAKGNLLSSSTYTTGRIDGVNLSGSTPQLNIGRTTIALDEVISVKGV